MAYAAHYLQAEPDAGDAKDRTDSGRLTKDETLYFATLLPDMMNASMLPR